MKIEYSFNRYVNLIFAVLLILVSCTPKGTGEVAVDERPISSMRGIAIMADVNTLCTYGQTAITVQIDGSNIENPKFEWQSVYGSIEGTGETAVYTAPSEPPEKGVDTVSVTVSGVSDPVTVSTRILILKHTEAREWVQTNGPSGGQIHTIEIDPKNPDVLYAAGKGGQVYKTENGGEQWYPLPQIIFDDSEIHTLLLAPGNPEVIYAGSWGALDKSVDGGKVWHRIEDEAVNCLTSIAMNPGNDDVLIAGNCDGRIYLSDDGGQTWENASGNLNEGRRINQIDFGAQDEFWASAADEESGDLFHTKDKGATWERVEIGQPENSMIYSIYVDEVDPHKIYIGVMNVHNEVLNGEDDFALFISDDGGATWQPERSVDKEWLDTHLRVIGKFGSERTLFIATGGRIAKSHDQGESWIYLKMPIGSGDIYDLAIDPRNENVIYIPRRTAGILKSADGGQSFQSINTGLQNVGVSLLAAPNEVGSGDVYGTALSGEGTFRTFDYGYTWKSLNEGGITHPWADEIVVNPHDPAEIWYVADVGQVFKSTDYGDTWQMIIDPSSDGFRFGSTYTMAIPPSNPQIIYGVKNGFGIFRRDNPDEDWRFLHQSDIDYTYTMAVHPENQDIIYSGYTPKPFEDYTMVRKSTDAGVTWETSLNIQENLSVTSLAIDPNQPETVYAGGTGEGGKLWVSYNGGIDWSLLNPNFNFVNIHVMVADPKDAESAYAAVWGGGTWVTHDRGLNWKRFTKDPTISASVILINPNDSQKIVLADRTAPVLYSTDDGGENWVELFHADQDYYRVLSAALAPSKPDVVYASIFKAGGPFDGSVFRIENGEAEDVTGDLPRLPVVLTVDPRDADTLYALLHGYGVYKSTNGGKQWQQLSDQGSGLPENPQVGFNSVVVDPEDSNILYLLGGCDIDLSFQSTGADPELMNTVYRSKDGGKTWRNLNDGNLGANSGSIKGLTLSPSDPGVLYIGAANGLYRSTDNGISWEGINQGLPYRHSAGVVISSDGSTIYAPTLGGGVYSTELDDQVSSSVSWSNSSDLLVPIHHVQVTVDPQDSQILYASSYPGGVFKSIDGGQSWFECNFGMASFEIDDPSRQGYYAFAISPSNPNILYMGLYGVGLYKSMDAAGTWMPMNGGQGELRGKYLTGLYIDPYDPDVVHVSAEEGIFRTQNGGLNWELFNEGMENVQVRILAGGSDGTLYAGTLGYEIFMLENGSSRWEQIMGYSEFGTFWPMWDDRPMYQYTSLLFHPEDPNVILFGTFPAGIYKSTDGGETWKESNVGWTNDGVFSLVYHPEDSNIIFAGTYNGVNRSIDGGDSWEMWDEGWPVEQWVFSIDFDPQNPEIMYACSKNGEDMGRGTDGFHGTVMKSIDGGTHWFPITQGLDINQEFYEIIVDRFDPQTIYLATQAAGVFISHEAGENWSPWNEGLTNLTAGTNGNNVTNTMVLSADGYHLYFGTAGSGVFRHLTYTAPEKCGCEN